jgi:hypothetical protein
MVSFLTGQLVLLNTEPTVMTRYTNAVTFSFVLNWVHMYISFISSDCKVVCVQANCSTGLGSLNIIIS